MCMTSSAMNHIFRSRSSGISTLAMSEAKTPTMPSASGLGKLAIGAVALQDDLLVDRAT